MKRFATMLAVLGLAASTTFGGVIFDPPVIEVDINNIPESVQTAVIVSYSGDVFDNVSVVVGSDSLQILDFTYTEDFIAAAGDFLTPVQSVGLPDYASDLLFGGFIAPTRSGEYLLGTLSMVLPNTAGGFEVGQEFIFEVNPDKDFGFSSIGRGTDSESLSTQGVVRIVPEPATLMLLGLGAVGLVRRRFA